MFSFRNTFSILWSITLVLVIFITVTNHAEEIKLTRVTRAMRSHRRNSGPQDNNTNKRNVQVFAYFCTHLNILLDYNLIFIKCLLAIGHNFVVSKNHFATNF